MIELDHNLLFEDSTMIFWTWSVNATIVWFSGEWLGWTCLVAGIFHDGFVLAAVAYCGNVQICGQLKMPKWLGFWSLILGLARPGWNFLYGLFFGRFTTLVVILHVCRLIIWSIASLAISGFFYLKGCKSCLWATASLTIVSSSKIEDA